MLKRYVAILLLLIANAIVIGHSMVPHHHHESLTDLAEHHGTSHQHGEEEEQGLGGLLSHIIHQEDGFTVNLDVNKTFAQPFVALVAAICTFSLHTEIPPLILHNPYEEHSSYSSPYYLSASLRGPPAFMA